MPHPISAGVAARSFRFERTENEGDRHSGLARHFGASRFAQEVSVEDKRFDDLTKVVNKLASRRTTLRGLVAGALATSLALDGFATGEEPTAMAQKAERKRGCNKNSDCKQPDNPCQRKVCQGGECKKETRPDGADCGGGSTCLDGQCPVTVSPAKMRGWQFYNDQNDSPIDPTFSEGPDTPPLGVGSAHLAVVTSGEGTILSANIHVGDLLRKFTTLSYSSYQTNSSGGAAPALNLGIDLDDPETPKEPNGDPKWQGRLVYVPQSTQDVLEGQWQTWDTLDDAAGTGTGNWYFTRSGTPINDGGSGGVCPDSDRCTFAEVLEAFPDIRIHPVGAAGNGAGLGFIGLKVGSGDSNLDTNVDALKIKLKGEKLQIFNFEPNS